MCVCGGVTREAAFPTQKGHGLITFFFKDHLVIELRLDSRRAQVEARRKLKMITHGEGNSFER